MAAGATRNHAHCGAAGLYSRIAVGANLSSHATSGHQLKLQPGQPLVDATGGSPRSFGVPTGKLPPPILDFGAIHDVGEGTPHRREIFDLVPGLVLRHLELSAICQAIGGFLGGVPADEKRARRRFSGANQGSFMVFVDIARFKPPVDLQTEVDDHIRHVSRLALLPGYDQSLLPGAIERQREQARVIEGVPTGRRHRQRLSDVAAELEVPTPW